MHELGSAAGIERIAREFDRRIAIGEIRSIDSRFVAEEFILMVVTGPQRRALGLGTPLGSAELDRWIADTVTLFLEGCRSR
jgi:TetR/AcrR family transcriptional repressor of mexJK operon